jgi:murein DD-endopeptidase MepM/ murein hydrolase activator NlpD
MRRKLLGPTLLGCVAVVLLTSGLSDPGADVETAGAPSATVVPHDMDIRPPRPTTTTVPTTTTTAPPPPTTTTTTAPPPPPPTTTTTTTAPPPPPPPEPEPEPEPAVTLSSGGGIVCPVAGEVSFTDTWGAARSGGRSHKGTDMMAATGTPTVAPVSGTLEHRTSSLGGLSWYVHADDGTTYYGTHLSGYESEGAGWVEAGTAIDYVGQSGNATTPHLHFEAQPGGTAVNPYPLVAAAC